MLEKYLLAKETISINYDENYKYYPMLVLGLTSLLIKYPEYEKEIIDIFLNISIFIEDKEMQEIVKSHQLEDENRDDYDQFNIYGLSHNGISFGINETNDVEKISFTPFIAISSKNISGERVLNIFLHEMLHLLKGIKNPYVISKIGNDVTIVLLGTGFNYRMHIIDKNSPDVVVQTRYETFDEVINVLQTTELMEIIASLDGIIPDRLEARYLDSLDKEKMLKDYGYVETVPLFKPLWDIPSFKKLLEDNVIEGKVNEVSKEINGVLGDGQFELFCDCLDYIDLYPTKDHSEHLKIINGFINSYKKSRKRKIIE